ncbi:MAG: LacI family DNA-binding transcriptional regulator [Parvularcula sp.]
MSQSDKATDNRRHDRRRLGQQQNVTLRDVAEAAGVSQMTVSRVLNTPDLVREKTREKVEGAIRELNYRPNLLARSLAAGGTLFIGLTYANESRGYLSEMSVGALKACRRAGLHLVIEDLTEEDDADEQAIAERLCHSGLDGIIVVPPLADNPAIAEALQVAKLPFVLISPAEQGNAAPRIVVNDRGAAADMTAHLIGRGHRDIAFIKGPDTNHQASERFEGYVEAMDKAGLKISGDRIAGGDYTYKSGMEATEQLLAHAPRPTAIFAANDDMAAGAIAAIRQAGFDVPNDLSVAGFDDTSIASTIWPPLTTMRQPVAEMAEHAVGLFAGGALSAGPAEIRLNVDLVERSSVGPPRRP